MAVDVSGIAGDVYGVVGAGITLGVLAGTTGMIMRSMERNVYGLPSHREEREEELEYRRPRPQTRTYQKRKTTKKRKTSKKRKTTKTYQRNEYEERPRYGTFSPYGTQRLNIPRYW